MNLAVCFSLEIFKVVLTVATPEHTLADDTQSVIEESEEFRDITIVISSEEAKKTIKANKLMLMARSPMFARMLKNDMMERRTNTIEIVNIDPDVFKIVLSLFIQNLMEIL